MSYNFISNDTEGHPLKTTDLKVVQERIEEGLRAILEPFGATSVVVSGAAMTGPVGGLYAISAGFVVLDGELLSVPAHSVPGTPGNTYYFERVTENQNTRTYQNCFVFSTRPLKEARVTSSSTPPGGILNALTPPLLYQAPILNPANIRIDGIESASQGYTPILSLIGSAGTISVASTTARYKRQGAGGKRF